MATGSPDNFGELALNSVPDSAHPAFDYVTDRNLLYIPTITAALSLVVFITHVALWTPKLPGRSKDALERVTAKSGFLEALDGPVIFLFKLARAFGVFASLIISIYEVVETPAGGEPKLQWALVAIYAYCSLLALLSIFSKPDVRDVASHHLTFALMAMFATYSMFYIWPLVKVESSGQHVPVVKLTETALLAFTGCIIPMSIPTAFRPTFPEEVPRPDQTRSNLSRISFTYVDSLIKKGYRVPDLKIHDLPELSHSDRASKLVQEAASQIDPLLTGSRRHIFWTLVWYFRGSVALMLSWTIFNASFHFFQPFALRGLLSYLEGGATPIQPWVWTLLIVIGPFVSSMTDNLFQVVQMYFTMQQQSILTQLIFKRALRLRLDTHQLVQSEDDGADDTHKTAVEDSSRKKPGSSKDSAKDISVEKDKKDSIIGRINNLVSSDMATLAEAPPVLQISGVFLQLCIAIAFLYSLLGWSAFIGLAVLIVCMPAPTYVGKLSLNAEKKKAEMQDKRVQTVTDTVGVMRMIKLFAWERKIVKQIEERREDELKWTLRGKLLVINMLNVQVAIPMLAYFATAAVYTVILKKPFPPSIAFASLRVFELVRMEIWYFGSLIPTALRAKVSYDRINEFLKMTDLLPEEPEQSPEERAEYVASAPSDAIGFNAASFSWHRTGGFEGGSTPSQRVFRLRSEGSVEFTRGRFNVIAGPTGSGKTSVLMALLGEMYYTPSGPSSWVSLPREGGVAYAAQESWVLNETIRDNIVFGYPYDELRYKNVLHQCGLERDLELWEAGDQTEVGEKGLTLSGGQKARVTLARALYSPAQTLLLDDVLAALDVHTAKRVVDHAFKGNLVKDRTVILVTHNLALVAPIADRIVVLGKDGQIGAQGTVAEVLKEDVGLRQEIAKEQAQVDKAEEVIAEPVEEEKKKSGKLIVAEEKAIGRVSLKAIFLYLNALGGIFTWLFLLSLLVGASLVSILEVAWIGQWASQYEKYPASEVPVLKYILIYGSIDLLEIALSSISGAANALFSVRACRTIHAKLIGSIFGAPLRWLDTVPVGRIVSRCTSDLAALDGPFSAFFFGMLQVTILLILYYATTVIVAGWPAMLCGAIVAGLGGWLGRIFLKAQLGVRREQSNARSPVMSQVGVALQGLVSIRAYGAQSAFLGELQKRIDTLMRCTMSLYNLNRWIDIRSNMLGALFSGVVAYYMVYYRNISSASVGFVLSVVVSFSNRILTWIRVVNWVEVQANSLERILDFVTIEQEPKPVDALNPPAYWPASGRLRVEGLSARYSDDSPEILKELTFEAKAGDRIGVVGRTGAGKSSLALALLRAIKTTGKAYYDDRATDTVNLDALRSSVTLIPQQPELLPGTVRDNLDPFGQHDDVMLNDALRAAGLFDLQERIHGSDDERTLATEDGASTSATVSSSGSHEITLDSEVRGGGSNFSVGQRQIIALARAMLRRSKLLILDEATAAIDYETDAVIQRFLRTELDKDTTVITIAHRLQTIMDYDKIMVLDTGKLVEFDSPMQLLEKEGGYFRSLVNESSDREHLVQMAKA